MFERSCISMKLALAGVFLATILGLCLAHICVCVCMYAVRLHITAPARALQDNAAPSRTQHATQQNMSLRMVHAVLVLISSFCVTCGIVVAIYCMVSIHVLALSMAAVCAWILYVIVYIAHATVVHNSTPYVRRKG